MHWATISLTILFILARPILYHSSTTCLSQWLKHEVAEHDILSTEDVIEIPSSHHLLSAKIEEAGFSTLFDGISPCSGPADLLTFPMA